MKSSEVVSCIYRTATYEWVLFIGSRKLEFFWFKSYLVYSFVKLIAPLNIYLEILTIYLLIQNKNSFCHLNKIKLLRLLLYRQITKYIRSSGQFHHIEDPTSCVSKKITEVGSDRMLTLWNCWKCKPRFRISNFVYLTMI